MIQVISSVLVHYLDSQTPPVQAELVGQEDRFRPGTYIGGKDSIKKSVRMWSVHRGICYKLINPLAACLKFLNRRDSSEEVGQGSYVT